MPVLMRGGASAGFCCLLWFLDALHHLKEGFLQEGSFFCGAFFRAASFIWFHRSLLACMIMRRQIVTAGKGYYVLKRIFVGALFVLILVEAKKCRAGGVCDDWVNRGGYCVDYVKSRVATFPVPKNEAEITLLNNREDRHVAQGDVAIFDLGNYWHVALIEKVHLDRNGNPTAIDVSEMNFGARLTQDDYRKKWGKKSRSEWQRAVSCGVTKKYGQAGRRTKVDLSTVQQIWSPAVAAAQADAAGNGSRFFGRIRQAFNRLLPGFSRRFRRHFGEGGGASRFSPAAVASSAACPDRSAARLSADSGGGRRPAD